MLPQICRLFDGQSGVAFNDQAVEVLLEQRLDRFGQVPHNLGVQILDLIENGERLVLKDRVGV
jgi:hypothetical protein